MIEKLKIKLKSKMKQKWCDLWKKKIEEEEMKNMRMSGERRSNKNDEESERLAICNNER